jgi:hypothetical protein
MLPSSGADVSTVPDEKVLYYRVVRKDLVLLKFILEAYEGMSTMSTVDKVAGIVRVSIPAGFVADMESLLAALSGMISLQLTSIPSVSDTAHTLHSEQ